MKQFLKKRKGQGFTLVELLIVIVIIGILAGSLLLVMGSATDKANATKVVSDLRTLKAASLMYYADNDGWPAKMSNLQDYLDRGPEAISNLGTYDLDSKDEIANVITFTPDDGMTSTEGYIGRLKKMAEDSGISFDASNFWVILQR